MSKNTQKRKWIIILDTEEEVTKVVLEGWVKYVAKCAPILLPVLIEEITTNKVRVDVVTQGLKDNDPDTLEAKMVIQRLKELKLEFEVNNVTTKVTNE